MKSIEEKAKNVISVLQKSIMVIAVCFAAMMKKARYFKYTTKTKTGETTNWTIFLFFALTATHYCTTKTVAAYLPATITETISSQSLQECKAGSETNAYRPDRTMKRHENGTPLWWRRYSPNLRAIVRAKTLNGFRVTKLNSVPFTGKLETLAEFDVDNIITVALRNDESKVLDSAVAAQFKATQLKYTCIGTASGAFATRTDGTATSTCTANFNVYHLKECVDKLKTIFVPKYDGVLKLAA